jgi:high affinity Mn2+ porin
MRWGGYSAINARLCLLGMTLCLLMRGNAACQDRLDSPPRNAAQLLAAALPDEPSKVGQPKKKDDEKDIADKGNGKDNGKEEEKKEDDKPAWYSVHGQTTVISQGNWQFHSPYQGTNSFLPVQNYRTTMTGTLYLGVKVWEGGEVYFNPEIAGGNGLSSTFGIGGFPNGEATRVGVPEPTPYIARLYLRQTLGLSSETQKVEDGPNQIAGERPVERVVFTIGRVPATDSFDNNAFSHDPRTQFLNWSLMYNGAWDYPANVRGYDYGGSVELVMKTWALRYGVFGEPSVANGSEIDPHILRANGHVLEYEKLYDLDERPGRIRLLAYLNNAHMGDYRVALREMPVDPDITQTRAYRIKYGFGINWEQEITKQLGVFGRIGWNDGHTETWAFTEIDGTISGGFLLKGKAWSRPQDQVGLGFAINDLSNGHRRYLEAGGLGFELGDGRLTYGTENIVELFYNWQLSKGINVTLDFQEVANPGYNRDRGPVSVLGIRVHAEF